MIACTSKTETKTETKNLDPLAGTFTSGDAKAKRLWSDMMLFSKAEYSFVDTFLTPNFTLKTAADTAVIVRGKDQVIAYWSQMHTLLNDVTFTEGRLQTFTLNNGEVWTGYFGALMATGKFTNKNHVVPLTVWIKWDGDKIAHQEDWYDAKFVMDEMAANPNAVKK
jgi:hypothetical protein